MPHPGAPDGYQSVIPYLCVDDADALVAFMQTTFDCGEPNEAIRREDGQIAHGEVRIGDAIVMFGTAKEEYPAYPTAMYVYVPDVDATYAKAIAAGAISLREPTDEFYGDRSGGFKDPTGNQWWIATHQRTLSAEDLQQKFSEAREGAMS